MHMHVYGSIPKQYCIGSTTSKSLYSCDNWGGSDNKYHRTNRQASEIIFHFPVESRRTLLFSRYFGLSSYEAWRLMWWYRSYKIRTSLYINRIRILVASEHQLVTLHTCVYSCMYICTVGQINFEDKKFRGFYGYLLNLEIKYPCNFLYIYLFEIFCSTCTRGG